MDYFAGLDISMDETHICILDRESAVVTRSVLRPRPRRSEAIAVRIDPDRRHRGHVLVHVNAVIWINDKLRTERSDSSDPLAAPPTVDKMPGGRRFDRPAPFGADAPPRGKRIDRWYLRVEMVISNCFMGHLPTQSSLCASSRLGRACSLPSKPRSR
jgi:hypothetical protein